MTKQDIIIEKLDRIIQLLEGNRKNHDIETTFIKANNIENTFVQDRMCELFQELDNVK